MRKLILLFVSVFVLTGCSVQYDLEIDKDTISEDMKVSILNTETDRNTFLNQVNIPMKVYSDKNEYYDVKNDDNDGNFNVVYSYKHDFSNYENSTFLNKCYQSHVIKNSNDYISISTDEKFNCIILEDDLFASPVTINITTKLKVISNNADKVSGDTYTWIIDESNYLNKPINIEMKIPSDKTALVSQTKNTFIMILAFAIPILLIVLLVYIKNKRRNKF